MLTVNNGDITTVKTLLLYGANLNLDEPLYGETALTLATAKNQMAIIRMLKLAGTRK